MKKYPKVNSGEWVQPIEDDYRMACCDCGLVHSMDFRIEDGRVQFRARRHNRATGQLRRFIESIPWCDRYWVGTKPKR